MVTCVLNVLYTYFSCAAEFSIITVIIIDGCYNVMLNIPFPLIKEGFKKAPSTERKIKVFFGAFLFRFI